MKGNWMKQFLLGFLVASMLWVGLVYAQSQGMVEVFPSEPLEKVVESAPIESTVDTDVQKPVKKKRRWHKRRTKRTAMGTLGEGLGYERGEGQVGDNLTGTSRQVGMDGGKETQLSNADIESAIDRRFNGIQRCLTLLSADAPTTGKLVIGMGVSSSGRVTKVNLKGPNAMIKGEPGACFRRIIRAMRFPSFSGPEMVIHYPIEFE